jgi:hypothetical protein
MILSVKLPVDELVLAEMDFHSLGMTTAFPSLPDQAA